MEVILMQINWTFIYPECQSCQQRTNCDACGKKLETKIRQIPGISDASVQLPLKRILIDTCMDPDDIEIMLEDIGILVN